MIKLVLVLFAIIFTSCSTMNVERSISPTVSRGFVVDPSLITAVPVEVDPPPPVVIQQPIFIPTPTPEAEPPPQQLQGVPAVRAANENIVQPQDFINSAMIYDFDRDFVYKVFTMPFRITNIVLEPGEQVLGSPFVSDSERWMLGAGVSRENGIYVQHIYVKPTAANLSATLIINTDRRVYHLILQSFTNVHMPIVRWRYHHRDMPQNFIPSITRMGLAGGSFDGRVAQAGDAYLVDPYFLSFNYRITQSAFRRPRWAPTLVYDDGRRTYIVFPEGVLMRELPAVFEDRENIVNFRVNRNIIIIDRLIEHLTVKLGNQVVTIEKLR